jgi:hypothetical protein
MNEPKAWVEMTELEQQLLSAAKAEQIPSELALRMASVLPASSIIPAVITTTSASTSATTSASGGLLSTKAGLWGFLSITLLAGAGAFYALDSKAPTRSPATRTVVDVAAPTVGAPAAASADLTGVQAPALEAREATPSPARAATAAALAPRDSSARASSARASSAHHDSAALREEISLLDRAREALEAGAPQRAQSLLAQHGRRFAKGTLVPEAQAMRIETMARLGDTERAQELSERFLSTYPQHPLRERVSAVTTSK